MLRPHVAVDDWYAVANWMDGWIVVFIFVHLFYTILFLSLVFSFLLNLKLLLLFRCCKDHGTCAISLFLFVCNKQTNILQFIQIYKHTYSIFIHTYIYVKVKLV